MIFKLRIAQTLVYKSPEIFEKMVNRLQYFMYTQINKHHLIYTKSLLKSDRCSWNSADGQKLHFII